MVKKTIEPEEFEYDEIEDEFGNKSIQKRKSLFSLSLEKGEDGITRTIRKRIQPDRFEYVEFEDSINGNRKVEKIKVDTEVYAVEDNDG